MGARRRLLVVTADEEDGRDDRCQQEPGAERDVPAA
jgi:hypothetical protein